MTAKCKTELQQRLDAQTAKLQETEENVALALRAVNEASTAKIH